MLGTRNAVVARRAARLLLDRLRLRRREGRAVRGVGRAAPAVGLRADEARGRARGARGLDRPLVVALRRHGARTSCGRCSRWAGSATRWRSSTTSAVRRPTSGTSRRPRGRSSGLPHGLYHVAADGDCTWADFAEAIFAEAGLSCRVRRITTAELAGRHPGPPTRSSAASTPKRRGSRTGATASASAYSLGADRGT